MIRGSRVSTKARKIGLARRTYSFIRRNRFGAESIIKFILGSEYDLLKLGRFRKHGEPHLWMYDRYSLSKLLTETGFKDVHFPGPFESYFEDWRSFNLDTEMDGKVYKPHSVYVEAVK